eukprot:2300507-Pyramimonas_sp.AAC.1
MSATLNEQIFADYFGSCPVIRIPGFMHPVSHPRRGVNFQLGGVNFQLGGVNLQRTTSARARWSASRASCTRLVIPAEG